jgi:signal transduction histidine kinase/ligand-binding sensor domain-containing protein
MLCLSRSIFLCLIFCRTICCAAQDFSYKMFTTNDGLAGSQTTSVFQDRHGYLWIGSDGGLSRYDGHTFKNYGTGDGLPSNRLSCGVEDRKGNIWFADKDNICIFDGIRFLTYPIEHPPENIWISQLIFTRSHRIWFITGNGMFELQNGTWKRHDLIPMHPHAFLNQVVELNGDSLMFNCCDSLVIRFADGRCQTIAYPVDRNQPFRCVSYIGGNCYVTTGNHLYLLKNKRLELIHDEVLANKSIRAIFVDRELRLWVGTENHGIYVFSGSNCIQINRSKEQIYGIKNFCQDYEGTIWVATSSGLMKLRPSWIQFYNSPNDPKEVRSSFKDQDGALYFGQVSDGFIIRKNNKFTSSREKLDKFSQNMVGNWISGFAHDQQKRLWLTDNSYNLLRITGTHAENLSNELNLSLNTNQIFFNSWDSTVYAGSKRSLIEIKNDVVRKMSLNIEGEDRIYTFASDDDGNIWIGTGKGKILEKHGNNILLLNGQLGLDSIPIAKIECIGSNELWIATEGKGLYKFHRTDLGSFVQDLHITSEGGLPNNIVHDFAFSNREKVWVVTLTGLAAVQFYKINGKENFAVTKYGKEDGFHNISFIYSSLLTADNGNIWLGTDDYIAQIHSDRILNDTVAPIVQIENVTLFNSNTEWSKYASDFTSFFHLPKKLVLPYNQNDIGIEYRAISFNDPDNITYSYKLEGIDKDWKNNGNHTRMTYGNLPPGNYVFKIRAKKPLSAWSSVQAQFSFIIHPPWWGSIWFRIVAAVLLICVTYLIYSARLKQAIAKAQFEKQILEEMLHERLRISRELHDDIGSTLGSISIYSEVAKKRTEKNESAGEALAKIGVASRQLIEKISDIVWSLDSANGSFDQLQNRMSAFLAMTLTPLDVVCDFIVDQQKGKIQLTIEQQKNVFLIFKEAVYNIAKYAECKKVNITLYTENKFLEMIIQDDGQGFDISTNNAYNGNGLKNMQRRAKDMKAIFSLNSQKGLGTRIELTLRTSR